MRTLFSCALLALVGSTTLAAQTEWPSALEERVAARVAQAWELPPEEIFLEWGLYRGEPALADAEFELVGSGQKGHWVVRVDLWNGTSASVRLRSGRLVGRPVATRRLARGEILADSDFETTRTVVWDAPGSAGTAVQAGWEVQRVIEEGELLRIPAVRAPLAVRLGARVEIVWTRGPIELSVPGKAAGSGVLGEEVMVRTDSGARIRGLVIAPGVVDISDAIERTSGGDTE